MIHEGNSFGWNIVLCDLKWTVGRSTFCARRFLLGWFATKTHHGRLRESLFSMADNLLTQTGVHQIEAFVSGTFLSGNVIAIGRHDDGQISNETREDSPFVMKPTVYLATRLTPASLLLPGSSAFPPAPRAMLQDFFTRETSISFTSDYVLFLFVLLPLLTHVLDCSWSLNRFDSVFLEFLSRFDVFHLKVWLRMKISVRLKQAKVTLTKTRPLQFSAKSSGCYCLRSLFTVSDRLILLLKFENNSMVSCW